MAISVCNDLDIIMQTFIFYSYNSPHVLYDDILLCNKINFKTGQSSVCSETVGLQQ